MLAWPINTYLVNDFVFQSMNTKCFYYEIASNETMVDQQHTQKREIKMGHLQREKLLIIETNGSYKMKITYSMVLIFLVISKS